MAARAGVRHVHLLPSFLVAKFRGVAMPLFQMNETSAKRSKASASTAGVVNVACHSSRRISEQHLDVKRFLLAATSRRIVPQL